MAEANFRIAGGPAAIDMLPERETSAGGALMAVAAGCRHPYESVAMLSVPETGRAGAAAGLHYIREHPEINQVMLTCGDAWDIGAHELRSLFEALRGIAHVEIIRLAARRLVSNPSATRTCGEWAELMRECSAAGQRIHIVLQIVAPEEVSEEAVSACRLLQEAGAVVISHIPVLRGVNDDPDVLAELLDRLPRAGVTPATFFLPPPSAALPSRPLSVEAAYRLAEEAKRRTSGLGKRVRLSIGHETGEIEILAVEDGKAYLKYHRACDGRDGRFIIADCPPEAVWFGDLPDGRREEETMAAGWVDDEEDFDIQVYADQPSRHYFTVVSD